MEGDLGIVEIALVLAVIAVVVTVIVVLVRLLLGALRRQRSRPCPRCGDFVPRGQVNCPTCGHDLAGPLGQPA